MTADDRIDRLEEKVDKLRADYEVLKYIIEKESLTDQLVKIMVNNATERLPEVIEAIKTINTIPEKE